jgi:dGTPase
MNHDLDDGFRAKLFNTKDLNKLNFYKEIIKEYGLEPNNDRFKKELVRNLINKMVVDLIIQTEKNLQKIKPKNVNDIRNAGFNIASFSTKMKRNISEIRLFLNKRMYNHKSIRDKTKKYKKIIENLYQQYFTDKADIPAKWIKETYIDTPSLITISTTDFEVNKKQMIIDYISGMTDRYILKIYNKI